MRRHIPNTITALNLFSGCIGISFAFKGEFEIVFYCLVACGIFDFLDGTAARLLHVKSTIGKELDSLADVVSFGFLPATVLFILLQQSVSSPYLPYVAYLVTIFSALRLAKFNVDDRQTTDFIGINTPMNSFLIISLPFIAIDYPSVVLNVYFLICFVVVTSLLLVSELKLFSMKMNDASWDVNRYKYIFILLSVILLFVLNYLALPFIFLSYIIFSYMHFRSLEKLR